MAERKLDDDVSAADKKRRLQEIIALQQQHSLYRTQQHMGKIEEVLIEKESKKSNQHWAGRNTQNTTAVFPKENYKIGDFVMVKMTDCTSATLIGKAIGYSENNS
jgi:tRNA-2-methylthio-N6-dimethylallyladenosine synthase